MPDPRFVLDPFEPAYRELPAGELAKRADRALAELAACRLCPRQCGVDRRAGPTLLSGKEPGGFCRTSRHARVTSAFAHPGEEDCLRGWRGSGAIFFGSCNLRCVFCQNHDISHTTAGEELDASELGALMLGLQGRGCHNINLVTPSHVVPQILEALAWAAPRGLALPIVYNSGGYDAVETLRLLDGIVDIYMPDFKFWAPATARRLAKAEDYPERARAALQEMQRQVGVLRFGPDGLARRGVLVRQLVMPGLVHESAAILRWLAEALSPDTFVNLMGQYRPEHLVGVGPTLLSGGKRAADGPAASGFADLNRRPTREEMAAAFVAAREAGIRRLDER